MNYLELAISTLSLMSVAFSAGFGVCLIRESNLRLAEREEAEKRKRKQEFLRRL